MFLKMRPQTAWLFAALLFFDKIPHNSLSNYGELWGILSKKMHSRFLSMPYESNFAKRCLLLPFDADQSYPARGPPLLKS